MSLADRIRSGRTLSEAEASETFAAILSGRIGEAELEEFLRAMAARTPSVDEIAGAARVMRANMAAIAAPPGAIDLCGTGGDGHGTLNVSTAVSFVVAGSGVPVAKHGNRSATSRAGAADVLETLGVKLDVDRATAEACLNEAGTCFLFAQRHHPAMKHVAAVRKRIGVRTIFNLLGPLSNPAGVRRQLIGVYAREMLEPLAQVLMRLGSEAAWIVHGSDGLDELTTTGVSHAAVLDAGRMRTTTIAPEEIGLPRAALADVKGGDAAHNAAAIARLLDGERGAFRDIVVLNAAAALVVAGRAQDLRTGATQAASAIDRGRAKRALDALVRISNRTAP
jgi:anthranilate phosphoribosyltransferase